MDHATITYRPRRVPEWFTLISRRRPRMGYALSTHRPPYRQRIRSAIPEPQKPRSSCTNQHGVSLPMRSGYRSDAVPLRQTVGFLTAIWTPFGSGVDKINTAQHKFNSLQHGTCGASQRLRYPRQDHGRRALRLDGMARSRCQARPPPHPATPALTAARSAKGRRLRVTLGLISLGWKCVLTECSLRGGAPLRLSRQPVD